MSAKRNVEGLRQNAQKKRLESIEKTEAGIRHLLKEGKVINFNTVAEAAGVSKAWLYKEPQIKERIEHLRQQQVEKKSIPPKQRASDSSKDAIIKTQKERIRRLEAENRGLRDHIEVVEGRVLEVSSLRKEVQVLRSEKSKLEQELASCMIQERNNQPAKTESKVTPFKEKKSMTPPINDRIQSELDELGIKANSTLRKLIAQTKEDAVLKAITVLKEALLTTSVLNPAGFLTSAIENTWIPSEGYEEKIKGYEQKLEIDAFNEWYPLARAKQLVLAAMQKEGVQCVLTNEEKWVTFEQMVTEYPMEVLQRM